jgi:hypothetical protein
MPISFAGFRLQMASTSQGMILTAKDSADGRERLVLTTTMASVTTGASIS